MPFSHGVLLVFSVLFVTGCLDRAPVEPLNAIVPPIEITWPTSGVSVMTGRREVLYDFQSAKATEKYDLVVNDSLLASFPVGTDGVKPHIYWNVDTSLIGSDVRLLLRA